MKERFKAFFPLEDEERSSLLKTSAIVLDANVLLSLYRVRRQTTEQILKILKKAKPNLWLPHQAAFEFFSNKDSVKVQAVKSYDQALKKLDALANEIRNSTEELSKDRLLAVTAIGEQFSSEVKKAKQDIEKKRKGYETYHQKEKILTEVEKIFRGRVGEPFDDKALAEVMKEGEKRYTDRIPPGFRDNDKSQNVRRYGDLIMWKQMMKYVAEIKAPLVFITDDVKEDWWQIVAGQKKGPRPELVEELFKESGQPLYMYTLDRFLKHAESAFEVEIPDEVIEDTRETRRLVRVNETRRTNVSAGQRAVADLATALENPLLAEVEKIAAMQKFAIKTRRSSNELVKAAFEIGNSPNTAVKALLQFVNSPNQLVNAAQQTRDYLRHLTDYSFSGFGRDGSEGEDEEEEDEDDRESDPTIP